MDVPPHCPSFTLFCKHRVHFGIMNRGQADGVEECRRKHLRQRHSRGGGGGGDGLG